jgi:uncharacterized protein (DUF697 family)
MNTEVQNVTSEKSEEARKIIRNYALGSIVPSLIPVPLVDLMVVTGVQLKMLHSLANLYGVPFKEELGRSAITALIGGTVALSTSRVVSSAIKSVPGIGSLVGALSMPVVNGGSTYAIGKVFMMHFESGGTMLSFEPEKVREHFKKEFEAGKAVVASAQASGEVGKDGTVKSK